MCLRLHMVLPAGSYKCGGSFFPGPTTLCPASSHMQAPRTSFDAYHRGAGEVVGGQSDTGDVLSLIVPTHEAPTDTIMLNVHLPATLAQGLLPASMPAMPITDADMIDASAPVLTQD